MKRFIIALAAAAFTLLAVTGCSLGMEDDLTGTVWESSEGVTLTFSGTLCMINDGSEEIFYSYIYLHPTVNLTPDDTKDPKLQGTISGTTMTVKNVTSQDTFGVFKRQ